MLNLGHSHPDFTYQNDERQAQIALLGSACAAVLIVAMILATLLM